MCGHAHATHSQAIANSPTPPIESHNLSALADTTLSVDSVTQLCGKGFEIISQTPESILSFHSIALQAAPPTLAAVIGALSAYLFNYFHWKIVERKRQSSRMLSALTSHVKEVQSSAVAYWIQDYAQSEEKNLCASEILIKSQFRLITRHISIIQKMRSPHIADSVYRLETLTSELFDLVTGNEFESKTRSASKALAMKISIHCSDMLSVIAALDIRS